MTEVENKNIVEKIVKAKAREPKQWGDKWQQGVLVEEGADGTWYNLYDTSKEAVEKQANEIEVGSLYSFELDEKKMVIQFRKTAGKEEAKSTPQKPSEPNTQTQVRREACINSAIALLALTPTKPVTEDEVLRVAGVFEQWVLK